MERSLMKILEDKLRIVKILAVILIVLVVCVVPLGISRAMKKETYTFTEGAPVSSADAETDDGQKAAKEYIKKPLFVWSMYECIDYISSVSSDKQTIPVHDVMRHISSMCARGKWSLPEILNPKFLAGISVAMSDFDIPDFKVISDQFLDKVGPNAIVGYLYMCGYSNIRLLAILENGNALFICTKFGSTIPLMVERYEDDACMLKQVDFLKSDVKDWDGLKCIIYFLCETYDEEFYKEYHDAFDSSLWERFRSDRFFASEIEKHIKLYISCFNNLFLCLKDRVLSQICFDESGALVDRKSMWLCFVDKKFKIMQIIGKDESGVQYMDEPFSEDVEKWDTQKMLKYVQLKYLYKFNSATQLDYKCASDADKHVKKCLELNVDFRRELLKMLCKMKVTDNDLNVIRDLVPTRVWDPVKISTHKRVPKNSGIYLWLKGYDVTLCLGIGGWGIVWQAEDIAYKVTYCFAANDKMKTWGVEEARYFNFPTCVPGERNVYSMPVAKMSWKRFVHMRYGVLKKHDLQVIAQQIKQAFQAVAYLHRLGYIHTDIKLDNFHIMPDDSLRLADFDLIMDLSEIKGKKEIIRIARRGNYAPLDPEQFINSSDPGKLDVFSLGYAIVEAICIHFDVMHSYSAQYHDLEHYIYEVNPKTLFGKNSMIEFFKLNKLYGERGCITNLRKMQKCIILMIQADCETVPSLVDAMRAFDEAVHMLLGDC